VGLRFRGGEQIWVHHARLVPHGYFAALLGPAFREGVDVADGHSVTLDEDLAAFAPVLRALYEGESPEFAFAPGELRPVLEAADRCGAAPALEVCLAWLRRHYSPELFYEVAPLLHSGLALASAPALRRTLLWEARRRPKALLVLTGDSRWADLPVGLREELLDALESGVAAWGEAAGPGQTTVADLMLRRGEAPGEVPALRAWYERLDEACVGPPLSPRRASRELVSEAKPLPFTRTSDAAAASAAGHGGITLAKALAVGGPINSKRQSRNSGGVCCTAEADVIWSGWSTTEEAAVPQ